MIAVPAIYPELLEEDICSHCEAPISEGVRFCPGCSHEARVERGSCRCLRCFLPNMDGKEDHFQLMADNAFGMYVPNEG
jgi:predicted amidophosphoribosyltransferase